MHDLLDAVVEQTVAVVGDPTPPGRRRSLLALVGLVAFTGTVLALPLGRGVVAPADLAVAALLTVALVALVLLPVPDRVLWPAAAGLVPLAFAAGLHPLDAPQALVGLLVVPVAWMAAFLSIRVVALHLASATLAIWWIFVGGDVGSAFAASVLWLAILAAVAILVGSLARGLRRAREEVGVIGDAIGLHFYRGVLEPDGTYVETYTGGGLDRLLGAPLDPDVDPGSIWDAAVHPDDRYDVLAWLRSIPVGQANEREYRLVGLDGRVRWIRDRARVTRIAGGRVHHEGICADVTAQKHAEESLARARRDLVDIVETIEEVVLRYELDTDGWRTTFAGPGLAALLGEAAAGHPDPVAAAALALDRQRLAQHRERALRDGRSEVEVRVAGAEGERRWVAERLRARREPTGAVVVAATLADVTERRRAASELAAARDEAEHRARTDPLTGVANRLFFGERLEAELDRLARVGGDPLGLVLVDVDRFKDVNDAHGHLAGDDVLVEVASRLQRRLRSTDTLSRWGGEEFAILLPAVRGVEGLRIAAEAVRDAVIAAPVAAAGRTLPVTVSIGAALAGHGARTPDELLDAADRALYRAKTTGRDRVELAPAATPRAAAS